MAFPEDVLPLNVELELSGTWTDITSYVQRRDLVDITRGRSDEATRVDRSTARLVLNNRDGRFSPRNPNGAYFGSLGRNTPIRISVDHGDVYLRSPGDAGDQITAPDAAALDITGDIDVRIDVTLDNWRETQDLCGKYETTGDQRSWAFYISDAGLLYFRWSPNGTLASLLEDNSTEPLPVPADGRQALRVTLDVNNGASGHTTTFYYADTIDGSWTQLGDAVTTSGTTSIFSGTGVLEVGDVVDLTGGGVLGKIHEFKLLSGIAGTEVANPDFSAQTAGDNSFADTASSPNTWTVQGNAELTNRRYRFHGEVSSWPQRWDPTGTDVYVPIEASGILRRLQQGASPLQSTLYRGMVSLTGSNAPVAYWPCEDLEGSQTIASGIGGPPMTIVGEPDFEGYTGFDSSNPIPLMNDSVWTGAVPPYDVTGSTTVRFLLAVPDSGISGDQALITIYCTGTAPVWTIRYDDSSGNLKVQAYDEEGTNILDSGFIGFLTKGLKLRLALDLLQSGSNVEWDLSTLAPGASTGSTSGGTLNSRTVGRVERVIVSLGGGITDTAFGHISVQAAIPSIFDLGSQLAAYDTENAGERVERLCSEEGIEFRSVGELAASAFMGPQRPDTLVNILQACADADGGMLYEPRDVLGIGYRTRESLQNQGAHITLDYDGNDLAESLEPVDDDQSTRNDITVTREKGSSARAELTSGALSTQAPPNGVGRYDDSVTINVQYDEQLPDQAQWRLHAGTVDEARYPTVTVNLARTQITGDAALSLALHEAEVGDRLTISDVPSWLPPEDVTQIIQGYSETLGNYEHEITFNCSPESPYQVAVWGTSRYAPTDCALNEDLDTTETAVDITTTTGPLWDTAAGGFDIMIGGERMTVSAVGAATGTVQTLTVTRSVNGVVSTHTTGDEVRLFNRPIRALDIDTATGRAVNNEFRDGKIVTGLDFPRTVFARDTTLLTNLGSTYDPSSPEVGVRFVAPSSGRVLITIGGGQRDATNNQRVFFSPQVLGDDLTTVVLAPSVESYGWAGPGSNSDYVFGSRVSMLDGLTPRFVYYARVMLSAEGTTAEVIAREISVEPVS